MYGDPIASTTATTDVPGCAIAPRASSESTARGRDGVIVGLTVYAPAGTDITRTDRIDIGGIEYRVEGEPGTWVSPFDGRERGIEIAVTRAVG